MKVLVWLRLAHMQEKNRNLRKLEEEGVSVPVDVAATGLEQEKAWREVQFFQKQKLASSNFSYVLHKDLSF